MIITLCNIFHIYKILYIINIIIYIMSFTRFYDDPCRVQKYLEETTSIGNYNLNVPGNGTDLPFIDDPHIRMEKWGANLTNNIVNVESDLKGLTRKLNRDNDVINDYNKNSVNYILLILQMFQTILIIYIWIHRKMLVLVLIIIFQQELLRKIFIILE